MVITNFLISHPKHILWAFKRTISLWCLFQAPKHRVYLVSGFWYQVYQARLWERLLTSRGLPSDSTSVLKAEPGKLDIKRREPGFLFISLPIVLLFKLAIMTSFSICMLIQRHKRRHSKSATSSWPDKGNMPWDRQRISGNVQQCSWYER